MLVKINDKYLEIKSLEVKARWIEVRCIDGSYEIKNTSKTTKDIHLNIARELASGSSLLDIDKIA